MKNSIEHQPDHDFVSLTGNLAEGCEDDLFQLRSNIVSTKVVFDCSGVGYINSVGVARWTSFVRDLQQRARLEFRQVPLNFLDYCYLIPSFLGGGTVSSFVLPFRCSDCGKTYAKSFQTSVVAASDEDLQGQCPGCGRTDEPDAAVEDYIAHFRDQAQA